MFHVGVLYRIPELLELVGRSATTSDDFVANFREWRGVSGALALEAALKAGWISEGIEKRLCLSKKGAEILDTNDSVMRLRLQVKRMVEVDRPPWLRLVARGREAVRTYGPPEATQCLHEAGLLSLNDEDTVSWWDAVASVVLGERETRLLEQGRKGERLSIAYETGRTGHSPAWIALEAVDAGYDVLSRVDEANAAKLHIEVKASQLPWDQAVFHLSRNEWRFLNTVEHACFHLWSITGCVPDIGNLSIDEVRPHIPLDNGDGTWREVAIPFKIASRRAFDTRDPRGSNRKDPC